MPGEVLQTWCGEVHVAISWSSLRSSTCSLDTVVGGWGWVHCTALHCTCYSHLFCTSLPEDVAANSSKDNASAHTAQATQVFLQCNNPNNSGACYDSCMSLGTAIGLPFKHCISQLPHHPFVSLAGAAKSIIFVLTKFCHDKHLFVVTNTCLSQQKMCFVTTKVCLSWQNLILSQQNKPTFVVIKEVFCHDKHMFVTKHCADRSKDGGTWSLHAFHKAWSPKCPVGAGSWSTPITVVGATPGADVQCFVNLVSTKWRIFEKIKEKKVAFLCKKKKGPSPPWLMSLWPTLKGLPFGYA